MAEFTPITTQEEFDERIKGRLERERSKYSDYADLKNASIGYESKIAELNKALEDAQKDVEANRKLVAESEKIVSEREATIKAYEIGSVKTKIASKFGLPFEAAERLRGNTEEEIAADAELLLSMFPTTKAVPPMANSENNNNAVDGVTAAFRKLNPNIKF